jgi:Ankyrin repeats (many copies)
MTFIPLMRAAKRGDVIEVRRLLESGADPNAGSGFYTALGVAAARGNTTIVSVLLEAGANADWHAVQVCIHAQRCLALGVGIGVLISVTVVKTTIGRQPSVKVRRSRSVSTQLEQWLPTPDQVGLSGQVFPYVIPCSSAFQEELSQIRFVAPCRIGHPPIQNLAFHPLKNVRSADVSAMSS